jgi:hypothetical protein
MEINMTKMMLRVLAAIAIAFTGSQTMLQAQGNHGPAGTWDLNVTVVNCQSGAIIRTVNSLQMFSHDGSLTETANTATRGGSVGKWTHVEGNMYITQFWFFRYNPDGTFKSMAEGLNKVELSGDGTHFNASGIVTDYDATGNVISVGCVTHAARRLTSLDN